MKSHLLVFLLGDGTVPIADAIEKFEMSALHGAFHLSPPDHLALPLPYPWRAPHRAAHPRPVAAAFPNEIMEGPVHTAVRPATPMAARP